MFKTAILTHGGAGSAIGRDGDVPLPGCGLFCGPKGAVACTGDSEFIALKILAKEVYCWIERCMTPGKAEEKAVALYDDKVDIGLIVLTESEFSSKARNNMASSHLTEIK